MLDGPRFEDPSSIGRDGVDQEYVGEPIACCGKNKR